MLRMTIRKNLIEIGYPSAKVDEVLGGITSIPESLVNSYFEMLRSDIRERVQEDEDFLDARQRGSK
jgi:hypothetical protein